MEVKVGDQIINMDESKFVQMQKDAKSWNDLYEEVAKCYAEPGEADFEEYKGEADLTTIGEIAANYLGFL